MSGWSDPQKGGRAVGAALYPTLAALNSSTYTGDGPGSRAWYMDGGVRREAEYVAGAWRSTYAGMSDIPFPWFIAHRGLCNTFPENTIVALDAAFSNGNNFLECDVRTLADGTLGVMHDATTTTCTQNISVANCDIQTWRQLVLTDARYGASSPPTLNDLLYRYGNKGILVIESKDGRSASGIVSALNKYGIKRDFALLQSFNIADMTTFVSGGYEALFLASADQYISDSVIGQLISAGVSWVGLAAAIGTDRISACLSAGLKVAIWTVSGRSNSAYQFSRGASAVFTNEATYTRGVRQLTAPHQVNSLGHYPYQPPATISVSDNALKITNPVTGYSGWIQGWCSPLPESVTIYAKVKFITGYSATRWVSLFISETDDNDFVDLSDTANGYHILLKRDGALTIYRKATSQAAALISSAIGTPIADNETATYEITISPTQIIAKRTDISTVCTADRPEAAPKPYLKIGSNGITADITDMRVSA